MSTELVEKNDNLVFNLANMQALSKVADLMASARVAIPEHLREQPGDCMAVAMQAAQWGMNPFSVAQKTHLINGVMGYEAQLVNAVVSSSKAIEGRFKYEFKGWSEAEETRTKKGGGTYKVKTEAGFTRVGAVLRGEKEITWGEWLNTSLVQVKNSPLWTTNPRQQSCYLAVKYWARLYCPEVILGVYTPDEFEDENQRVEREINPQPESHATGAEAMLAAAMQDGTKAEPEPAREQPGETIDEETGEVSSKELDILDDYVTRLELSEGLKELQATFGEGWRHITTEGPRQTLKSVYDERKAQLEKTA